MIQLATLGEIPFLLTNLQALPLPPEETEDSLRIIIEDRTQVVMIDDAKATICRLVADPTRRSFINWSPAPPLGVVDIPWLLPRAKWNVNNIMDFPAVLLAALDELVVRIPAANDWPCGGEFEGEQVNDPASRLIKSREIGNFWKQRFFSQIRVEDTDYSGLARAEAQSVAYLRRTLRRII